MKPKFIQVDCVEGSMVDLRQAKAVLRYKPNLIFLEYPGNSIKPITKPRYQPKSVVLKYPWIESDNYMWVNIVRLWKEGRHILVYAVDGSADIVTNTNIYPFNFVKNIRTKQQTFFGGSAFILGNVLWPRRSVRY